jgi:hypothetical protein
MSEIAQEFVRAYYTSLVYQRADLRKYYDQQNATIWRTQLNSTDSLPFAQADAFLIPDIETGSTVTISDFNSLRLPDNGLAIVVNGSIGIDTTTRLFGQYFILSEVSDRYFVMSDSLSFTNAVPGTPRPPVETFLVPPKKPKSKPRKKSPGDDRPASPPNPGPPPKAESKPAPIPKPESKGGPKRGPGPKPAAASTPGPQQRMKPKDADNPFVYIPTSGQ